MAVADGFRYELYVSSAIHITGAHIRRCWHRYATEYCKNHCQHHPQCPETHCIQLLIVIYFAILATAGLLPLRIEPNFSTRASASRPQAVHGQVTKAVVAVASIDKQEDDTVQDNDRYRVAPEPSKSITIGPILADVRLPQETGGKVSISSAAVTSINNEDGVLVDYYTQYNGNGSPNDGWPKKSSWISFQDLYVHTILHSPYHSLASPINCFPKLTHTATRVNSSKYIFSRSCKIYNQEPNSKDETADVYSAIQKVADETLVDHRFILAIIMQESGGCVRAPTSNYGVPNPGMMQDHNGTASCNNGVDTDSIQNPCPADVITQMVEDGVGGTEWGDGLAQCINQAEAGDVSAFYRAARIYNSGSIDESGDLGKGGATHCYASDVANRLTGWVKFEHRCDLDV